MARSCLNSQRSRRALPCLFVMGLVAAYPAVAAVPYMTESTSKINPIPPEIDIPEFPEDPVDLPPVVDDTRMCKGLKFTINDLRTDPNQAQMSISPASMISAINADAEIPKCFFDAFDERAADCEKRAQGYRIDDCVAFSLVRCADNWNKEVNYQQGLWIPANSDEHGCEYYNGQPLVVYLDDQCNALNAPPVEALGMCSLDAEFFSSPISLVWEKGYDPETEVTVTEFPLNPGASGRSYVWKASEKAPLLVYDPSHRGEITSATQLFGDWTFGGKRAASLGLSIPPAKWENGYEALATLDRERDGALSGAELEPLGLWFDKNRDGISQPGEVKTLDEAGVVKVFVKPDRRDEHTRAVHASLGYERVVDGMRIVGPSIDWYGRSASDAGKLTSSLLALSEQRMGEAISEKADTSALDNISSAGEHAALTGPSLNGTWRWRTLDSENSFGGYLTFSERPDKPITGRSYALMPGRGAMGMVVYTIKGKRTAQDSVAFIVNNATRRQSILNTATFLPDGTLRGSTSAEVDVDGKRAMLRYEWEAERVVQK